MTRNSLLNVIGGRVGVLNGVWSTFTIDSGEIELERRRMRFHADRVMNNPETSRISMRTETTRARRFRESGGIAKLVASDGYPAEKREDALRESAKLELRS